MNVVTCLWAALLGFALGGAALARESQVVSADLAIARAVVFCHNRAFDTKPAPGTDAGWIAAPREMPMLIAGAAQKVPAVLNMGFGVIAQAAGDEISGVTIRVFKPGATRPETWDARFRRSHETFSYWYFGSPAEMVLGDWRIEAIEGDRVLYSVGFKVVRAETMPDLAKVCD